MQCKDIPTQPILEYLSAFGGIGCTWKGKKYGRSVTRVMPQDAPPRLVHAKMRKLIYKGLASGCDCGCIGNFDITEKGRGLLRVLAEVEPPT